MIHGSPWAKLSLDQHERLLESVFLDLSHELIPFGLGPWSSDLKGVWATTPQQGSGAPLCSISSWNDTLSNISGTTLFENKIYYNVDIFFTLPIFDV
jgi:hypothetical protein